MPIIAQELIPINVTHEHEIIINQFKTCNCLDKSKLINVNQNIKSEILNELNTLTSEGLITCTDEKCCIKTDSFNSFLDKLNNLKM